eukprot:jgi/Mesvir1/25153/Mv18833-RA.1
MPRNLQVSNESDLHHLLAPLMALLQLAHLPEPGRRFPTYRGLALIGDRGGEWAVNLVRQPVITITHDDGRSVYRREYGLNGVAHLPIAVAWAYDQLQHLLNPLTGRVDRDRRQQTVQNLNAEVQQLLQILRAEVAPPGPLETRSRRPTQLFTVQPTEADAARMQRSMERWSPEYVATIMETRPFQDDSEDSDYEPGKRKGKKKQKKKRPSGGTAPGTSRSHAARRQLPAPAGTAGNPIVIEDDPPAQQVPMRQPASTVRELAAAAAELRARLSARAHGGRRPTPSAPRRKPAPPPKRRIPMGGPAHRAIRAAQKRALLGAAPVFDYGAWSLPSAPPPRRERGEPASNAPFFGSCSTAPVCCGKRVSHARRTESATLAGSFFSPVSISMWERLLDFARTL